MKKILFPTDFSESSQNAFTYALRLAEALEGQVDLMHVYHLTASEASRLPPDEIEAALQQRKVEASNQLDAFRHRFSSDYIGGVRVDYGVFVYQEIIDAATQLPYDLIVMGMKGKHPKMEKALGSVTTHVMMHSSCPVLAIPDGARYHAVQSIAYATDFHPADNPAVGQLMTFAGRLGADVHFVHVDTKVKTGSVEDYIVVEDHPFKFTDFFVIGGQSVLEGLEHFIERKGVDILALFIPNRRLWERLFHQSFTKKMAFQARLPLLVFHE